MEEQKKEIAPDEVKTEQKDAEPYKSRYQRQLEKQWKASHPNGEPAPIVEDTPGQTRWMNRKQRRFLSKLMRKNPAAATSVTQLGVSNGSEIPVTAVKSSEEVQKQTESGSNEAEVPSKQE